jgi:uncharacterized membrane protein
MAFCGNCGASLSEGTAFCGSCGTPVGAAPSAAASSAAASSPVAAPPAATGASSGASATPAVAASAMTSNTAAALAYILGALTGVLFLVLDPFKNDRFVRFHALQSIFFSVACIAFWIVWSIVWGILISVTAGLGALVDLPLILLISLGIFAYWIFLMYQAYSNRLYKIPYIGDMAAKQVG